MNPLTITALTTHIAMLFENDERLRDVWVLGEISNWKRAASGHVYFRLKDAGATINAVIWKQQAAALRWQPRDGDQVQAHGYVSVYKEGGAYQIYVNQMEQAGKGQLYAQFEQIKAQLQAEGLFDAARKRLLPTQPQRIGVVTSADAAALRDILRVLSARWPLVDVIIFHTLVQGAEAPRQIADAIRRANAYSANAAPLDLLIVARGGGSIEDLWAFNDRGVAYAIAESALPVVSGVGHEVDFTIADFVADLRAPTPSAAAAAATPSREERLNWLRDCHAGLAQAVATRLAQEERHLEQTARRLQRVHPRRRLDLQLQRLDDRQRRLQQSMARRLERSQARTESARLRLATLNPQNVLARGYSIVQHHDGRVVRGPADAQPGEALVVRAAGGAYEVVRGRGSEGVSG
jgi:exodeoxyribonuclease VII large subunit